jgi:hypothetical protein
VRLFQALSVARAGGCASCGDDSLPLPHFLSPTRRGHARVPRANLIPWPAGEFLQKFPARSVKHNRVTALPVSEVIYRMAGLKICVPPPPLHGGGVLACGQKPGISPMAPSSSRRLARQMDENATNQAGWNYFRVTRHFGTNPF